MAVQAPLFSDASQDWILYAFPDSVHPLPLETFSNSLFSAEFERQSREIDLFLHLQKEKLKQAIQHQKMQQLSSLLNSLETKAAEMMRKTEHELGRAMNKNTELSECVRRAEMEREAWERIAKENEQVMLGLNMKLGQAQHKQSNWAGPAQDAESGCGGGGGGEEDDKMGCKWCRRERACVVLFPCRHLCACRGCGGVVEMCPVCGCVKEGSVEVFF